MSASGLSSSVVVGIDGSMESRVAAQYALDAAAARHRDVLVVHSYQPAWPVAPVSGPHPPSMRTFAIRLVEETLAGLVVHPSVSVETRVDSRAPVELLREISENAALLVIGQHHFSITEQLLVGTVASPLAASSVCPVVVVPGSWSRDRTGPRPIVVALDGESSATAALDFAFDEAELRKSEVIALHAAPVYELASFNSLEQAAIGEILAGQKQDHPDIPVKTLMVSGEASDRIVEASRVADLLVIGRPHHHRPVTLWTRSVAHAVLSRSACPLVIVPQAS